MDDAVGHLLQGLEERNLDKHVNIVIVSLFYYCYYYYKIQFTKSTRTKKRVAKF